MAVRNTSGQFETPPPAANGEQTGPQSPGNGRYVHIPPQYETAFTFGSMLLGGASWSNPMSFPGFGMPYQGTYTVYRWILNHPIVRLVRSIRMGIIGANTWEYDWTDPSDKGPQAWMDWTRKTFNPIRQQLIWDIMADGHDMGWVPGEPIWEYDNGRYRLVRVKPLLQDASDVLQDRGGNPIGIRNTVPQIDGVSPIDLPLPFKGFHYAYDSKSGYVYGRSWLENIRDTAWKSWLNSAQQLERLGAKISGTVTIITSPAGTFPGPPGADGKPTNISFRKNAEKVIADLANGAAGAWFPSLGLQPDGKGGLDAMKVMAQLIGKSLTNVEVKDYSGNSAAVSTLLEKMKHEEELIFAGGLRSPRTGMESEHGSRADAGEHTNTATFNAEDDDEKFAAACQPLVDANLTLNFTPNAKGKIRIKPPSLVDRKTSVFKAMLLGLINDPDVASQLAQVPGLMDSLITVLDVSTSGGFDVKEFKARKDAAANAKNNPPQPTRTANPEPQGGRPPQ